MVAYLKREGIPFQYKNNTIVFEDDYKVNRKLKTFNNPLNLKSND